MTENTAQKQTGQGAAIQAQLATMQADLTALGVVREPEALKEKNMATALASSKMQGVTGKLADILLGSREASPAAQSASGWREQVGGRSGKEGHTR